MSEPPVENGAEAAGDPLLFAVEALAARGALVEPSIDDALAVLPPELARALGLPEDVRLVRGTETASAGEASCALGAPLLDRLISWERARTIRIAGRLPLPAPRTAQIDAAVGRLVVRNGVADTVGVSAGEATYLHVSLAWVAEADDRYDGRVGVAIEAGAGGLPEESLARQLRPEALPGHLVEGGAGPEALAPDPLRRLVALARRAAEERVAPLREAAERRLEREHARIVEYFADLVREAIRPRKGVDPAARRERIQRYLAERDAKLADLPARYRMRVALQPVALCAVAVPAAAVRLRLRRRRGERELVVRLPAGARAPDRLACEGCDGHALQPALCDDRLHVLCEQCCPSAQGRPECPACRPRPRAR